ncbi:hypothetical protein IFM89_036221 [Coptis chinensis]|uniref:RanBP2-type domain-containing protein n=1 Tax=Coptis chinensis TaxID=261450 RepID=A0A835M866_9MAGN|nr:hypothetical protein IFM89_036221 [Coptis chinensis]
MGEGREGDWECGSCTNRNYAFRSFATVVAVTTIIVKRKVQKCGQPKEVAKNARNCNARSFSSILCTLFCRAQGAPMGGLRMNMGMAPNSLFSKITSIEFYLVAWSGWRTGDWICNCGFHNYSSRGECKKCNASLPSSTTSSMVNTTVHRMFPSHGTKRLASEEFCGEWENKRLNAGDINNHFLGYEHIGRPGNDQTSGPYPYRNGSSITPWNSQGQVQLPQLTPVPTLLGKG